MGKAETFRALRRRKQRRLSPASPRPEFSVVIATRNRAPALRDCLQALARQSLAPDAVEILVVDNGSHDATCATVTSLRLRPPLIYLFFPTASAAAARNYGASQARGKWLAFLDDDCTPPRDWLARARKTLQRRGVLAAGGPALLPRNSPAYPRWFLPEWEDLTHGSAAGFLPNGRYLFEGNLFFRRDVYLAHGGMRTSLGPQPGRFGYHEGTELQKRLATARPKRAGLYYDPGLRVTHNLQPTKTTLAARLHRQFLGGIDHASAFSSRVPSSMAARAAQKGHAAWRLVRAVGRLGVIFLRRVFRSARPWQADVYLQSGRDFYRWGEACGPCPQILRFLRPPGPMSWKRTFRQPLVEFWRRVCRRFGWGNIPLQIKAGIPWSLGQGSQGQRWFRKGEIQALKPSRTQGPCPHPHLAVGGDFQQPPTWIVELKQAKVYGPSLAVVDQSRNLLAAVSMEWSLPSENHGLMRRFGLSPARRIPGTSALLAATGGNSFHHWMIDVLPQWLLYREAGLSPLQADWILLPGRSCRFQSDAIQILGIPDEKILCLDSGGPLACETLWLPSPPASPGHPSRRSCEFLRRLFLRTTSERPRRRLLLGRTGMAGREVPHWEPIRALCLRAGFEELEPSRLSLTEQARTFAEADWVVGVHGAALTNLVFCHPGTRVIELFSWGYVNPCYRDLCGTMSLDHHGVVPPGPAGGPTVCLDQHDASRPVEVTEEMVRQALRRAGYRGLRSC